MAELCVADFVDELYIDYIFHGCVPVGIGEIEIEGVCFSRLRAGERLLIPFERTVRVIHAYLCSRPEE